MSEENRDYVQEAVDTFIKGADLDPTDPVKAINAYFEKNAREDLKARAKAEHKTASTCWGFIEAVASKALNGRSGHIDPVAVYAIAMHYFEDVPADWNAKKEQQKAKTEPKKVKQKPKKEEPPKDEPEQALPIEIEETPTEETSGAPSAPGAVSERPAKKAKKHFKKQQGFFFDVIETRPSAVSSDDSAVAVGGEVSDAQ